MSVVSAPRHRHSPRVRRLAAESGVELDRLAGSGPAGRVTTGDVRRASTASAVAAPSAAARSVAPGLTTAQPTSVVEVDLTRVMALLERAAPQLLAREGTRLTVTAFVAKAVLEALTAQPLLNASIDPDGRTVVRPRRRRLGITVDVEDGVRVPVLHDGDQLNLVGLARRVGELADRARTGSPGPDDPAGGTFTLTDTGSRGALWDTPVLVPGQAGHLGLGAVVERPVVLRRPDGERVIGIRSMAYLALTYDHRLVDGAAAARFLFTVRTRLETARFEDDLA